MHHKFSMCPEKITEDKTLCGTKFYQISDLSGMFQPPQPHFERKIITIKCLSTIGEIIMTH